MGKRQQYGVSSAHPLATEAGLSVLEAGGNAVDAAVAISYMLGVVEPHASGIGGGGVMLVLPANGQDPMVYDYREVVPKSGVVSKREVGVPGFVKGMEQVHRLYGVLDIRNLIDPAIKIAEEGFAASGTLHRQLAKAEHADRNSFARLFPEGKPIREGERLIQPSLASTMQAIRDYGSEAFYKGEIPLQISAVVDGMTPEDFSDYKVTTRTPILSSYDRYDLITVPPPFGGITLIQALKLSEKLCIHEHPNRSMLYLHQWGEAIAKCYSLRRTTMCDPAFYHPPVKKLISEELISSLAKSIRCDCMSEVSAAIDEVSNTTHFVVTDQDGMCVSTTNTIGGFFGSGIAVGGFFLNNQLRNFTNDANSPNIPQPGKRPQSYASPTILRNDSDTIVIGSAGGKRIPLTLSVILQNIVKKRVGIEEAVSASRFFIDDNVIHLEHALPRTVEEDLKRLGYEVTLNPDQMFYGGVHGLMINHKTGQVFAAADPRRGGAGEAREALDE